MCFAVLSDFHGNLTALDAVIADLGRRKLQNVVHGGDLALIGGQPAAVIDRVRELGWPGVVGNVDKLLWDRDEHARQLTRAPRLETLLRLLFDVYAPATLDLIGPERLKWLRSLPTEHRQEKALVLHAAPGDLWRAPMPEVDDDALRSVYEPCRASLVVYGHIHRPFVRELGQFAVANSGSVGSPFDGDPRASYLVIEHDRAQIVRVEYDIERESALLSSSGYPDAHRISEMRRRARFVPPSQTEQNT